MRDPQEWSRRTLAAINEEAFRGDSQADDPDVVALDETRWALGRLSDEGLEKLNTFIHNLTRRAPMSSPVFEAQRIVLEAFDSDVAREIARREAKEGRKLNGHA